MLSFYHVLFILRWVLSKIQDAEDDCQLGIPSDYWLTNASLKYLLVCVVCRGYKEISQDVTLLPAGDTCVAQHANTIECRVVVLNEAQTAARFNELNVELTTSAKQTKLTMGNKAVNFQQIQNIWEQIKILKEMKDIMVGDVGDEVYQDCMFLLTCSLPGWGDMMATTNTTEESTTVTAASTTEATAPTDTQTTRLAHSPDATPMSHITAVPIRIANPTAIAATPTRITATPTRHTTTTCTHIRTSTTANAYKSQTQRMQSESD